MRLGPLVGPAILILAWWLADILKLTDPIYLPHLSAVAKELSLIIVRDTANIWATLYRTLVGFGIAAILGVGIGVLLGVNKKVYSSLEFLIDFFRSLPAPALFPLFLLLFGINDSSKIAIVAFVAFWVIVVNTIHGVWQVSELRIRVGQVFRASSSQILTQIVFPSALPEITTGLRVGLSLALILSVVAEMFIGTGIGLGQEIYKSYTIYRIDSLYANILLVGLLGYLLSKGFMYLEKKVIHWPR